MLNLKNKDPPPVFEVLLQKLKNQQSRVAKAVIGIMMLSVPKIWNVAVVSHLAFYGAFKNPG